MNEVRRTSWLRLEQREVDHIQPTQDAVNDCPEDRMIGVVADRHGERATEADAPFRTLSPNCVSAVSVHRSLINSLSLALILLGRNAHKMAALVRIAEHTRSLNGLMVHCPRDLSGKCVN